MISLFLFITACSNINKKTKITMYIWDKSMCKQLTPWLEEEFPDVEFVFIAGYDNIEFYESLNNRGKLPDIFTCRQFSMNDGINLSDTLLDMSETELVGTFHTTFIENYRDMTGAIKWLPMCAEIDGIIANKDLFDKYNLPLPENYEQFANACKVFEENDIGAFYNDYAYDYSCLEALQGCAAAELMSRKGMDWRIKYANEQPGTPVGLDFEVWSAVLKRFENFLNDTYAGEDDIKRTFYQAKDLFLENKCAMLRGTGNDCVNLDSITDINCVMLPYYGDTSEDNWILTYPMYQIAVNKNVEQDEKKYKIIMEVLRAMFSETGQTKAATGSVVLSYNGASNLETNKCFEPLNDCIKKNHLYQRISSKEMFEISLNVAQKMIKKEYSVKDAYEDFNKQLLEKEIDIAPEIIFTQDKEYPYYESENGCQASSSVANTLRNHLGSDILITYSPFVTSSVFKGGYTLQEMKWLIHQRAAIRTAEMNGSLVKETMEWLINSESDDSNPVLHRNMLPVTSGIEYTIKDKGEGRFELVSVTLNGKKIDENKQYSVVLIGDNIAIEDEAFGNCPMPEKISDIVIADTKNIDSHIDDMVLEIEKFEEPTEYLNILK